LIVEHARESGRRSSRKRSGPVSAEAALRDLARRLGISRTLREYEVLTSWSTLVGDRIARVTVPERIERGVLTVSVASAAWRSELSMRRREILDTIHRTTGEKIVKEIRFR
jgi:predicted nucleic acid-binding Zn ribbon protein